MKCVKLQYCYVLNMIIKKHITYDVTYIVIKYNLIKNIFYNLKYVKIKYKLLKYRPNTMQYDKM